MSEIHHFWPQYILDLVLAREMIDSGESLRKVRFGHAGTGNFYLSDDKAKVIGDKSIMVDGKEFHIQGPGHTLSNPAP